ncbi:ABC transporter permease subunit [Lysinibacter cavernae]|nr:ABC transporter permease subunit [Lysinibacter cavernae]
MSGRVNVRIGPFITKLILLGMFDALAVYAIFLSIQASNWIFVTVIAVIAVAFNWIYLRPGANPSKYLAPGFVFLLIFQVFVIGYTGYISFTNFGGGHTGDKDQAIASLIAGGQERVEDSPSYPITVVKAGGTFGFLVTDDGEALFGTATDPLHEAPKAVMEGGVAVSLPGYESLNFQDILNNQKAISDLAVPFSDDINDGTLRTQDGRTGYLYLSHLSYDADADTITDGRTGTVYHDGGKGSFVSESGDNLKPGWTVTVGFENFTKALTDPTIRGPLVQVTIWTFVLAFVTVFATFFMGLFLAIVFNKPHMRGRKIYRTLLIVPYAFPAFLGALVWSGMFNRSYGFVNEVLFFGADIPWLTDPILAKFVVIFINLWLGFPYMFLVTMGALQSIPAEVEEAATVDGASPWQIFRLIKLPLLLVSVAPLLIASFAFNFNNFNVIYMTTGGGPKIEGAGSNIGHTDILISMVYKIAFDGQTRDYGLASVLAILIFIIVTIITIISFRQTKALEEIN